MDVELGLGALTAALALGIRHGVDWDHIAAITDITSTSATVVDSDEAWLMQEPGILLTDESHHSLTTAGITATRKQPFQQVLREKRAWTAMPTLLAQQRRPLCLGTLYALGHGTIVTILGLLAILASRFLPGWLDPIMERVVGTTLLLLAVYLFYSLYRYFRGGGEFRIRSRWMLIFAGVRNGLGWLAARVRGEREHAQVVAAQQYGVKTAYGVGVIHGVGAETGTQVLIIATAVGAGSTAMSVATLLAFVVGLLIANSVITIITTVGFISVRRRQQIYALAGLVAAFFSLAVGLVFLLGSGIALPDLGRYFRWVGGPS